MKRVKEVLLISVMALFVCVSAGAQEYTGGYGGIKTSSVTFEKIGNGVAANISAVKKDGEPRDAIFAVAAYKDGKLVKIETDKKTIGLEAVNFKVSIAELDSFDIKAMLVSADSGFYPLANPAQMPTDESVTGLKQIKVENSFLEGFSADVYSYEYVVPRSTVQYPKIEALTLDSGTEISIDFEGQFPGTAMICATASDGAEKTYAVKFDYPIHAVKGAMKSTDFEIDPGANDGQMSVKDVLTKSVGLNKNRNKIYTNLHGEDRENGIPGSRYVVDYDPNVAPYYNISTIAEDLEGLDYFITKRDNVPSTGDLYEFELASRAEVIVLAPAETPELSDYAEEGDGKTAIAMVSYANNNFLKMFTPYDVTPLYSEMLAWNGAANVEAIKPNLAQKYNIPIEKLNWSSNWATSNVLYTYRYTKVFEAGETVTIPATSSAPRGFIVVVKAL